MSTPAPRKATRAFGQQPLFYLITLIGSDPTPFLLVSVPPRYALPFRSPDLAIHRSLKPRGANFAAPQPVILKERPFLPRMKDPNRRSPPTPLLYPSQIGVAFKHIIPSHPRLARTSELSLRLA